MQMEGVVPFQVKQFLRTERIAGIITGDVFKLQAAGDMLRVWEYEVLKKNFRSSERKWDMETTNK
jgi:hypothetical protein